MVPLGELGIRLRAKIRYGTTHANVTEALLVFEKETGLIVPKANTHLRGTQIDITINQHGFRGPDFLIPKPPRTKRIVCVGASTTFCTEARTPWPRTLETKLRLAFPNQNIEVINAAVPGYGIEKSLLNLEKRVLPLSPDLVILYHANNDLFIDTRIHAQRQGIPTTIHAKGWLGKLGFLGDLINKNIIIQTQGGGIPKIQSLPENLTERFVATLEKFQQQCKKHEVPLVLMTYQTKVRENQPRNLQIQYADVAFYYMPWMTLELLQEGMKRYNASIITFAHLHHLALIDDSTLIPADDQHFADYMHLTDLGCQAMAQRVFRSLENQRAFKALFQNIFLTRATMRSQAPTYFEPNR